MVTNCHECAPWIRYRREVILPSGGHPGGATRRVGDRWRLAVDRVAWSRPGRQYASSVPDTADHPGKHLSLCWNRDDGQAVHSAVVSLTEDRVLSWEHQSGGASRNLTVDEWHEVSDHALREDLCVIEALTRRDHRYVADVPRHLGISRRADTREVPGALDRVIRRTASGDGGGQSVCAPGQWTAFRGGSQQHGTARGRGLFVVDAPPVTGEYIPHLVPGQQCALTSNRSR